MQPSGRNIQLNEDLQGKLVQRYLGMKKDDAQGGEIVVAMATKSRSKQGERVYINVSNPFHEVMDIAKNYGVPYTPGKYPKKAP